MGKNARAGGGIGRPRYLYCCHIGSVAFVSELRHGLITAGSCRSHGRPRVAAAEARRRFPARDVYVPREKARATARDFLTRYPKGGYMSAVETWRELPSGDIEFTMRRLRSAD